MKPKFKRLSEKDISKLPQAVILDLACANFHTLKAEGIYLYKEVKK